MAVDEGSMTFGGHDPGGRATLIAGVLGLILGLAVIVCGCAPRSPAPMIPSEGAPLPRYCAQAIRGDAELVVLCADTWRTCEEARLSAVRWGWWRKVHAVTPNCYRSDRKVIEAHEQRSVIR
jgi:hypothetical protein